MAAFPQRFTSATRDEQFRIIDLGILLLDLIKEQQPLAEGHSNEQDQKIMKLLEELGQEKESAIKQVTMAQRALHQDEIFQLKIENARLTARQESYSFSGEEKDQKIVKLLEEQGQEKESAIKQATMAQRALYQDEIFQLKIENARLQARQESYSFSAEALRLLQEEISRKNLLLEEANQHSNKSSQQIGKQGEKEVETLFAEYVHADIINMAAIGHSGDFHIRVDNGAGAESVFLVDSKKYMTAVPKSEREKIARDVDDDSTIAGGLLISLNSTVQNRHHFQVDITETKKPILYLCLKDMSYEESGRSIAAAIRILNTIATTHDQDEKDNLLKKIQGITKELSQRIQEATNIITTLIKTTEAQTKLRDKLKKNLLSIQTEEIKKAETLDSYVITEQPSLDIIEPATDIKKTRGRKPKV